MKQRFDSLDSKIDSIVESITEIKVDQAEIKTNLKEHMRRTLANEEANRLLKELLDKEAESLHKRVKPLETWVDRIKFGAVIVTTIGSLILAANQLGLFQFLFKVN